MTEEQIREVYQARKAELEALRTQALAARDQQHGRIIAIEGAIEDCDWWVKKLAPEPPAAPQAPESPAEGGG